MLSFSETALFKSSIQGHIGITTFLFQINGIDVNKPHAERGATPLYAASGKGHVGVVKLLLGAEGIAINQPMNDGTNSRINIRSF